MHIAVSEGTGQGMELDVNNPYHFKATQGIRAFPDAALKDLYNTWLDSLSMDVFLSGLLFAN